MSRSLLPTGARWVPIFLLLTACVAEYQVIPGATDTSPTNETEADDSGSSGDNPEECPEGWEECNGDCIDTDWDSEHCGGCDERCLLDTECINGVCLASCSAGCEDDTRFCDAGVCRCRPELINCQGLCVNPFTDPEHCGNCWDACPESLPLCGLGTCRANCDGFHDVCEDWCTSFESDPLNCGSCDVKCGIEETCVGGDCVPYIPLDPVQCEDCPCEEACDFNCCFSLPLDINICIDEPECPFE